MADACGRDGIIMSTLNGKVSYDAISAELPPFGESLKEQGFVDLNGCMSIAADAQQRYVFALSERGLVVFDIADKVHPREVASITEVCCGRDIRYYNGFVYIAARENGLYIVDVRHPCVPRLVYTYDTFELATAIDVVKQYCFVANRHLGVEIIDITDPTMPKYVSSFLCGEAQSIYISGQYAYVGDWMNKQVRIADISNIENPRCVSFFEVDGFADGVFVKNKICYVATGHHSASLRNRSKYDAYPYVTAEMLNCGYGCGHGLELFDVSNPIQPMYLSSVKFPPLFNMPDLWKVTADDHNAYVSDTNNGFFVVDVSDSLQPRISAYYKDAKKELTRFNRPQIQVRNAPITNSLCLDGYLYLCGSESGIHIVSYPESHFIQENDRKSAHILKSKYRGVRVFQPDGQLHHIVCAGETIFAAAGNGGLLALDENFAIRHALSEMTLDVRVLGDYVLAAHGQNGVKAYRYNAENGFMLCGTLLFDEGKLSAREIAVLTNQQFAVQLGLHSLCFVKLLADGQLHMQKKDTFPVMLYYRNLCQPLFQNRFFVYSSLNNGFNWYEISDNDVLPLADSLHMQSCPLEDGIAVAEDYAIVISRGRYAVIDKIGDSAAPAFIDTGDTSFQGVPFLLDKTMVLLNRCNASVDLFDISDLHHPQALGRADLPRPSSVCAFKGEILVCCGHDGLFRVYR